jgi:hypothetical protein
VAIDRHRLAELRSLALHREAAKRIVQDPSLLAEVRGRVTGWLANGQVHPRYAHQWDEILRGGPREIARAIVRDDEGMRSLRQCTPFAGIVDARTRWAIWDDTARKAAG